MTEEERQKIINDIKAKTNQPNVILDEPMTKEEAIQSPVATGKVEGDEEDILRQMQEIIKEYNGETGSIPINHIYWTLLNRFKTLRNK